MLPTLNAQVKPQTLYCSSQRKDRREKKHDGLNLLKKSRSLAAMTKRPFKTVFLSKWFKAGFSAELNIPLLRMKWREYSLQATPLMRWHCVLCIAVRCACGAICARSLTSKLADALRLIIELCEFAPPTQNEKGMLYGIPFLFWSKWRVSKLETVDNCL